jgi:methylated-DNA-[protein]-cysteine S-methyltransferase
MTQRSHDAERFAEATDALLATGRLPVLSGTHDDLELARRLYASAPVIPDPAFAASLRAELLARVSSAGPPESVATVMRAPGRTAAGGRAAARQPDEVHYSPLDTPFGRIFIAYRNGTVVASGAARDAASFERSVAQELHVRPIADGDMPAPLQGAILDHLEGRRRFLDVDLTWLRPFHRRVLEKTAEIPRGEVRPYSWIAREIGSPGATRAVGTALGRNPIPFIIPCHRVVRADGSLGEYSGGGPEVKQRILAYEGVPREAPAARA